MRSNSRKEKMALAKRYRREGYLKARNEMLAKLDGWRTHYKRMYDGRTDQADAQMCLGRVFATEDIIATVSELGMKKS